MAHKVSEVCDEIFMWQEAGHSLDDILVSLDWDSEEARWGDVMALPTENMSVALVYAYGNDDGIEEMMTAKQYLDTFVKEN